MSFIPWDFKSGEFLWETKNQEGYFYKFINSTKDKYKILGASEDDLLLWNILIDSRDPMEDCF